MNWYPSSDSAYYPWLVLAAATVAMVFTFGTPLSYGIFIGPFAEEFDLPRVALSTVFAGELFAFYAGSGLLSVYATKLPARAVILACSALCAVLSVTLFVVDSFLGLLVVFTLLGAAIGTVFVLLVSIVPQWFDEYRGAATGVLLAGNGFSLFALPLAWQTGFDRLGPRAGFFLIVLASSLAFALVGLCCRRPPWADRSSADSATLLRWFLDLFRSRQFLLLLAGKGLAFAWYYLLAAYAIDLLSARGFGAATAAGVFGLVGGVSIASRIGSGVIADRLGYRPPFFAALALTAVGGAVLLVPSPWTSLLAVVAFGLGLGGITTLYVPILLQVYDPAMSTAIVGTFNLGTGTFALVAPPVALSLTSSGDYTAVIVLTILASLGAISAFWLGLAGESTAA